MADAGLDLPEVCFELRFVAPILVPARARIAAIEECPRQEVPHVVALDLRGSYAEEPESNVAIPVRDVGNTPLKQLGPFSLRRWRGVFSETLQPRLIGEVNEDGEYDFR